MTQLRSTLRISDFSSHKKSLPSSWMGLLYLADLEAFPKAKIYHYSCLRHRKLMDIHVKLFSHYHLAVYGKKWEERLVLLEPGSMALTTRNTNFILWYNHTEWSKYIILQSIFILVLQTNRAHLLGVSSVLNFPICSAYNLEAYMGVSRLVQACLHT